MDTSEIRFFDAPAKLDAPAKVLKLSTAMRIGSRMRPQTTKFFFHQGGSCALGAAWEGATGGNFCFIGCLIDRFPALDIQRLREEITERNDAGQTRESIATWLESQGL